MTLIIRQEAAPDPSIPAYWRWRVWIEANDPELDEIESVRYQLHQTFPQPTRVVVDRKSKFRLSSKGWGEFTIYAAVNFKDAKRGEQLLSHWLSLGGSPKDAPPIAAAKAPTPSVFLSSSFADIHLANGIADALRARQVRVIDPNEPKPPGITFAESVVSKLNDADIAVMIIGEHTGEWASWETKQLLAEDKDIIPVVFAEAVPDPLAKFNPIKISPGEPAEAIADRIVGVMPGLKGRWSTASPVRMAFSENQPLGGALRAVDHPYINVAQPRNVKPYFKLPQAGLTSRAAAAGGSWNVPDLCEAYNWPTGFTGRGVIAIVELGGGWVQSDIDQFFSSIGQPSPQITDVSVDGTQNTPNQHFDDPLGDPDTEVALDIEVAGAAYFVATGQPATIRVYWAQDIASAVRDATADGCDVCSISWGADEAMWGAQAGRDMEQAAADATKAGMVVFAALGDNDSSDGGPNPANVDLPASAPHVIGCGGTRKTPTDETVWNNDPGNPSGEGTGGGFSTLFQPLPDWQVGAPNGPGRMMPDVSADADPNTGYNIALHGQPITIGGTSAVAPLYAGLFASFGTKLGWITPQLYLNQACFNDITQGDNGAYRAGPGPDPCAGIGSPIGTKLAQLFTHPTATSTRRLRDIEAENKRLLEEIARLTQRR